MEHLNNSLKKRPIVGLLDCFFPEQYYARDIRDFIDNKGKLELTHGKPIPGFLFNRRALISFPTASYYELKDGKGELVDFNSSLTVRINSYPPIGMSIFQRAGLRDRMILREPRIIYSPDEEFPLLRSYNPFGIIFNFLPQE